MPFTELEKVFIAPRVGQPSSIHCYFYYTGYSMYLLFCAYFVFLYPSPVSEEKLGSTGAPDAIPGKRYTLGKTTPEFVLLPLTSLCCCD